MNTTHAVPLHPTATARLVSVALLPGVRAGSAMVHHGSRFLIAQDDDYTLVWLEADSEPVNIELVPLRGSSGAMAKSEKPDFEAACTLPGGQILVMGSGSAQPRRSIVLLDPVSGDFTIHNAGRLYDLVSDAVGHELNVEAVLPTPTGLRVFHRGNSGPGNATVDVSMDIANPSTARVADVAMWDLGTVPGENGEVSLTFTDADIDSTGRSWFISAAEDTPNAIDDGPVVGAGIGMITGGQPWWVPITEADGAISCRKYEGLVVSGDRCTAWLVTDPDDEDSNAELCRVALTY